MAEPIQFKHYVVPEFKPLVKEVTRDVGLLLDAFKAKFIYQTVLTGKGLDFDRLREYQEGDDAVGLDWKALARTTKPYLKVFKEERMLDVIICVDVSNSMLLGTTDKTKNELAARFAATIGFVAQQCNDNVGMIMFSDKIKHIIPPSSKEDDIYQIIQMLCDKQVYGGSKDYGVLIDTLFHNYTQDSAIFIISDFVGYENYWHHAVAKLSSWFRKVFMVMVRDPVDTAIPEGVGKIWIADPYSGDPIVAHTDKIREDYNKLNEKLELDLEKETKAVDAHYVRLSTESTFIKNFALYLDSLS